jgi:hypothetical protein
MRVRITQKLYGSMDGIHLSRFTPGFLYDVGTPLADYLLAIEAAEPVNDQSSPALVVPLTRQLFEDAAPRQALAGPRACAPERSHRKRH